MAKIATKKSRNGKGTKPPIGPQDEVSFEFIKGTHFRVISVDGAFGGVSPQGRSIHMAVFSERRALPRKTFHPLKSGSLGDEILDRRESRTGFIRELEADLAMDLLTAMNMHKWLGDKIDQLTKALTEAGSLVVEEKKDA